MTCKKNELYELSTTVNVVQTRRKLGREWEHTAVVEAYCFCQNVLEVWKRTEVLELAEILEVYWVSMVLEMWKNMRC
jgi:hypothetical protein